MSAILTRGPQAKALDLHRLGSDGACAPMEHEANQINSCRRNAKDQSLENLAATVPANDRSNPFAARKVGRYPVLIRGFARSDLWRRNQDWRGVASPGCKAYGGHVQRPGAASSSPPRVVGHYQLFQQNQALKPDLSLFASGHLLFAICYHDAVLRLFTTQSCASPSRSSARVPYVS